MLTNGELREWTMPGLISLNIYLLPEFLHVFADLEHFVLRLPAVPDVGRVRPDLFPVGRAVLMLDLPRTGLAGVLPFPLPWRLPFCETIKITENVFSTQA